MATAQLYRMETENHVCPFGLKARHLLKSHGYEVEDHTLESRAQTDAFKARHDVKTTPQTFIEGERIGGHDDLRRFLGLDVRDKSATTYRPVIAIFATTALMAMALVWNLYDGDASWSHALRWVEWFLAFSMVVLAVQKLQDVDGFANGFLGYDLLARRWVPYASIYPFAEAFAGLGMMAALSGVGLLMVPAALVGLFVGAVGAVSVYRAVYVEKRDIKCACVGGNSNVPLGFISLTENVMMIAMGLWMLGKALV